MTKNGEITLKEKINKRLLLTNFTETDSAGYNIR